MSETYFVSHFINGLKAEIRYPVQGQVPPTMERAIMLAKIQQKIQEKGKENFRLGKLLSNHLQHLLGRIKEAALLPVILGRKDK